MPHANNAVVEEIVRGALDLHVHAGPDPYQERRLDALEAARHAQEMGLAGFVLKSHHCPTAPMAYALTRMYPGLTVLGSLCLNEEVGGLNPAAVEASARLGARVVWFPTFSADHWRRSRNEGRGITVLTPSGDLSEAARRVVETVARHDLVLASGHLSPQETLALFREARAAGVRRLLATHPWGTASLEEQREMAELGAYVEYTLLACLPGRGRMTPAEMAEAIRSVGVDRCVVTTDLGQWTNPPAAEGLRMAAALLLEAGMESSHVEALVKKNPRDLVGL